MTKKQEALRFPEQPTLPVEIDFGKSVINPIFSKHQDPELWANIARMFVSPLSLSDDDSRAVVPYMVIRPHLRSGCRIEQLPTTRQVLQDGSREDIVWTVIDCKGMGLLRLEKEISISAPDEKGVESDKLTTSHLTLMPVDFEVKGMRGLFDDESALHDHTMADVFLRHGIRSHCSFAVLYPKFLRNAKNEIFDIVSDESGAYLRHRASGECTPLPQRDGKPLIPVLQVRLYRIKYRIEDLATKIGRPHSHPTSRQMLDEAIRSVCGETLRELMTPREYLEWFFETHARNLARLHALEYTHGGIHRGNITLDCRLTDHDTVESFSHTEGVAHGSAAKRAQTDVSGNESQEWNGCPHLLSKLVKEVVSAYPEVFHNPQNEIEVEALIGSLRPHYHEVYRREKAAQAQMGETH